jgi:transposase
VASGRDAQEELIASQKATIDQLSSVIRSLQTGMATMQAASQAREAELLAKLDAMEATATAREKELSAKLDALLRKAFGKSSEKMPTPAKELRKGRTPEAVAAAGQDKRKRNEQRKSELETEIVPHTVPESQRACPSCASADLTNSEPVERVDYGYVPGYFRRRVHRQEVLVCACCATRVVADAPARPFEKSPYEAGLIAHVIVQKCACSVPIYRLEKQFQWLGIPLSRSTMTDLFHAAAEKLKPLYLRLLHRVATSDIVLADETTLAIQKSKKRGYMWTFRTDKLIAYKFSASRSGKTPRDVLGGTKGTLLVDAYTGYNPVVNVDGRQRAACLAHVRRKFFDALQTAPEAQQALDLILGVYRVEHRAMEQGIVRTEVHARLRKRESRAAMKRLRAWIDEHNDRYPPKGPMGKALSYALDNWEELQVFLDDVNVPVDNNASERALRIVALGRKNFLFVGHEDAGQNLAVLYSLMATCEEHGVDPHAYLADVLVRIDVHPNRLIDELLPDRWAPTPTA